MSWSPDLYIGELRPWPDSVHVVRGNTDEARRYFPERKDVQEALERRIDELCAEVEQLRQQNDKLTNVVGCLMYVKPRDVTSILVNGKVHRIDNLLADAGLRWEDA